jgi:GNAT superfamily N-acetyltransferase
MNPSHLIIRPMRREDFAAADGLRRAAGWNQTLSDWDRFLQCEPEGCFVAEAERAVLGAVTTIAYGRDLGWIGMLLVHPDHRRLGIGSKLLERALQFLEQRGVRCIKLDATPAGQPVYERFGFKAEFGLSRWQRGSLDAPPTAPSEPQAPLAPPDLALALKLDRSAFGFDRSTLLNAVASRSFRSKVLQNSTSDGYGFGLLRSGSRAFYLGPVVATSNSVAHALIESLLAEIPDQPVFWDVLEPNKPAAELAAQLGFTIQRPLVRMHRGPNIQSPRPELQYAIIDPAVG